MAGWAISASGETVRPCKVKIEGTGSRALSRELLSVSETWSLRNRPPPTLRLLRRRAERDAQTMLLALRAKGYYAAEVKPACVPHKRKTRVTFRVRAGPLFLIRSVAIGCAGRPIPESVRLPTPARLGLTTNAPARAETILAAEQLVRHHFQAGGFPKARLSDHAVVVDHAARRVDISFQVEPGPLVLFGPTRIQGLVRLHESHVRRLVPWREGDLYNVEQVELLRNRLTRGGLFSSVQIESGKALEADDRSAVSLTLKERRRRLVEAGVGYATDRGAGTRISWMHRNLFGGAERLHLQAEVSESIVSAEVTFRRPQFLRADQELVLDVKAERETAEAYTSQWIRAAAGLERTLSESLQVQAGLAFRLSEVKQEEKEEFFLLSVPVRLLRDTSNDLLDPTRGTRWTLLGSPSYDLLNHDMAFLRVQATAAGYWRIAKRPLLVLAGRLAAGSLLGPSRNDVPADERFYAGGGGSIRGYAYQEVGPLDDENDPVGGRSLLESSLELRWRAMERMGFVLFADGGTAFEETVPDFDERFRWGAGAGWRYYLSFGLVRFDVAVPLDKRPDVDEPYQVYLSIGQAF
ncbi:MAG: autotransporter assembly complex protein TamA [Verrucomicrobia bacterium]|nr:autotransporter assembly complex protein TamA [Verrucomicrobiota bacterium]